MRGKTRIFYEKEKIKMEENMDNVIEGVEDGVTVIDLEPCDSAKKGGLIPLIGVGLLAVVGAIGTIIYKNKDKIEERKIAKSIEMLEKKGYTITKDENIDDSYSEETED